MNGWLSFRFGNAGCDECVSKCKYGCKNVRAWKQIVCAQGVG